MKTAICKSNCQLRVPYPNAATRREVFQKAVDTLLVAASGMGIGAILLLLMVL